MSLRREMSLDSGTSSASSVPKVAEKLLDDPAGFRAAFVKSVVGGGTFSRSEMAPGSRARRGSMPNLLADLPGSMPDLVADLPVTSSFLQHPAALDGSAIKAAFVKSVVGGGAFSRSEMAPGSRARRGSMSNLYADLPFGASLQQLPGSKSPPRMGRRMSYQPLESIESFLANSGPKLLVRDNRSGHFCPSSCCLNPHYRRGAPAPLRCPVMRRRGMAAWTIW